MKRDEAKRLIANSMLGTLSEKETTKILSEYWYYETISDVKSDIATGEIPNLSERAISVLVSTDSPQNVDKREFEPLLLDMLIFRLKYSTNEYLELRLRGIGLQEIVDGQIVEAGVCPCCHYLSIDPGEDGLWDICPVCFWENGGDGPNHMKLSDAQKNFEAYGVMDERFRDSVEPDGRAKYAKSRKLS